MGVAYHPAREVGGDLYDFERDSKTLQIVLGDVSGKSIPAALYGAVFSGQLRTLFSGVPSPGEALRILNRSLVARYPSGNYTAVQYCRIDLRSGSAVLANGGMPFPFLVRGDGVTRLQLPGVPLGLIEDISYDELGVQTGTGRHAASRERRNDGRSQPARGVLRRGAVHRLDAPALRRGDSGVFGRPVFGFAPLHGGRRAKRRRDDHRVAPPEVGIACCC